MDTNEEQKSRQKNGGRKIFNAENVEERRETQSRLTAHPGGMPENSPTFQRWVVRFRGFLSPEGTAELGPPVSRPFGTNSISGFRFPTLKRWAIIACPFGTKPEDKKQGRAELEICAPRVKNI